jgi:hypothetical protein
LQHPGIPPVHERGRLDDGRVFFAMRLVDGRTLKDAITPWLSSAAEELGKSYDDFDLTDPIWTAMVDQNGNMLDDQSWRTKIRTDDKYKWEGTERARQEYQQTAGALARLFGGYRFGGQ